MIDRDLIEELPESERDIVKVAIRTLAASGILSAQQERLFRRVAQGSDTVKIRDLAEDLIQYRKDTHALMGLQQLGEQLLTEIKE